MKKIKVGIIGQGRSGRDIHRHLFENYPLLQERFDVIAVADPIPERCANSNANANPDCRHYADYKELLKDSDVELIINCSRSHKHTDISIEAMQAGYNVVCEKPLARKVSDVDRIIEVQKRTGKFFAVFQQARFRLLLDKICEVIKSGDLGKIVMVKACYHSFGRRWDWQTIQGFNGGELLNTAPHPLDQMLAIWELFGDSDPERIFAKLVNCNNAGDAEDYVKLVLEGKDHPVIDLEVIKQCLYPFKMYQVYGSNGSLTANGNTVEWKFFKPADAAIHEVQINTLETTGRLPVFCGEKLDFYTQKWEVPENSDGMDNWGVRYYCNIYDAFTKGEPLKVTLPQIRRQVAIIEECHRQNPLPISVKIPEGML